MGARRATGVQRELERSFFDSRIDFGLDLWLCIDVAESLTLVLVF